MLAARRKIVAGAVDMVEDALAALIVGGVGIANAVNAYLDSKRTVIATFKSLGGGGNFVVSIYLIQVLALASIGVALGLALGAIAPFVAAGFLEAAIPVETRPEVYPVALLVAAAFGYMTALAFALLPLGRTRDIGAAALFRDTGAGGGLRIAPSESPISGSQEPVPAACPRPAPRSGTSSAWTRCPR